MGKPRRKHVEPTQPLGQQTDDPQLWPCPRCQAKIPSTSQFCPTCGLQLVGAASGAPPAAPTPGKSGMSRGKKVAITAGVVIVALLVVGALGNATRPPAGSPQPAAGTTPRATGAGAAVPPASPTPPGPPAGSAIGDKVRIGDSQYATVQEAEYSRTGYSEFFTPEAGNYVYAFLVEIEGIDPSGASYNPLYFSLEVDGFEYDMTLGGKEPTLRSGNDLAPGQRVRGWVSFEAPPAQRVTLSYSPTFGLSGTARWTIDVR